MARLTIDESECMWPFFYKTFYVVSTEPSRPLCRLQLEAALTAQVSGSLALNRKPEPGRANRCAAWREHHAWR
jgi:hypothetical protein